jgi:transposase-like protein
MLMMPLPKTDASPPTEVPDRARRRTFTAEYKRRILREADNAKKAGEVAALLRREGLYSSHLVDWRKARELGELAGGTKPRGPAPQAAPDARDLRIAELERENAKLDKRARCAEAMVALQKKMALLMEALSSDEPGEKG